MNVHTPKALGVSENYDVVCFSHLRWDFVFQRPQHLMSRFAREHRVFFIEEPIFDGGRDSIDVTEVETNIYRLTPRLMPDGGAADGRVKALVDHELGDRVENGFVAWFYTPMMCHLADGL